MSKSILTSQGQSHDIASEQTDIIRSLLGRKRSGTFLADSEEALKLLDAIDSAGTVGNEFTMAIKGRNTIIRFTVKDDGLHFETIPANITPKAGTVAALRVEAKSKGLKGYSRLNKGQLEEYLQTGECPEIVVKPGSAEWLRAKAKALGLRGYSKLRKAELEALLAEKAAA